MPSIDIRLLGLLSAQCLLVEVRCGRQGAHQGTGVLLCKEVTMPWHQHLPRNHVGQGLTQPFMLQRWWKSLRQLRLNGFLCDCYSHRSSLIHCLRNVHDRVTCSTWAGLRKRPPQVRFDLHEIQVLKGENQTCGGLFSQAHPSGNF